jgi:hypothetical protein
MFQVNLSENIRFNLRIIIYFPSIKLLKANFIFASHLKQETNKVNLKIKQF